MHSGIAGRGLVPTCSLLHTAAACQTAHSPLIGFPPELCAGVVIAALFPRRHRHISDGCTIVQRDLCKPHSTVDAVERHMRVCVLVSHRGKCGHVRRVCECSVGDIVSVRVCVCVSALGMLGATWADRGSRDAPIACAGLLLRPVAAGEATLRPRRPHHLVGDTSKGVTRL
jgi:hypothetical protein